MPLEFRRLLQPPRRLRRLIRKDGEWTPERVHELRTVTRRMEALQRALSLGQVKGAKSLCKDLRRTRRCAGKVRDMDVLILRASNIHVQTEEDCTLLLLVHLADRRRTFARRLDRQVRRMRKRLRKNLRRAENATDDLIRSAKKAPSDHAFGAEVAANAVELAIELTAPAQLTTESLHDYRIQVKHLHNMLQLTIGAARSPVVEFLGEVKDAIGEWHDWQELTNIAGQILVHGARCTMLTELEAITKSRFEHATQVAEEFRNRYGRSSRSVLAESEEEQAPVNLVSTVVAAIAE